MSYQDFPSQLPSTGSTGGAGASYLGINGVPNPRGYLNPGGYPGGYSNAGSDEYPDPGNAVYGQGYYHYPGHNSNASDKSRLAALLPTWFLGVVDIHRFYVGEIGGGIMMISTLGGPGIWTFVGIIMTVAGPLTDVDGRPVTV